MMVIGKARRDAAIALAELIGDKLSGLRSSAPAPSAASFRLERTEVPSGRYRIVWPFELPAGRVVDVYWPDAALDGSDDLALLSDSFARSADRLTEAIDLEEQAEVLRDQAEAIFASARQQGLDVRLIEVGYRPVRAGARTVDLRLVYERPDDTLQLVQDWFDIDHLYDLEMDFEELREIIAKLSDLRRRVAALGGEVLLDQVALDMLEELEVDRALAIGKVLTTTDWTQTAMLDGTNGRSLILIPRDGAVRCICEIGSGMRWEEDTLRVTASHASAGDPGALAGRRIGDLFDHLSALDPNMIVTTARREKGDTLLSFEPPLWVVSRLGTVIERFPQ